MAPRILVLWYTEDVFCRIRFSHRVLNSYLELLRKEEETMKSTNRILKILLTLFVICLCAGWMVPAWADETGELTVYSSLDKISEHGNVYLMKDDREVLQPDLEEAGIGLGDTVKVTFLDQELEMPVAQNFSEAETGSMLLRVKEDATAFSINMGEFASEYIADKSTAEDGSVTWAYKDGIEGPVEFHIVLIKKGEGEQEDAGTKLSYTSERSDYPDLTDEEYANFRVVTSSGMGNGALYRTSSPIDPEYHRNTYADEALKKAGVSTVMNLADNPKAVENQEGFAGSYYSTTQYIALGIGMTVDTEEFRSKLADGLRFFVSHEGPYAIHCQEGKDRTGIVVAILECLMGASYEEVIDDYMVTFYNYFGIKPGDEQYDKIVENNIASMLRKVLHTEDPGHADLAKAAREYLQEIGLSEEEIKNLSTNLGKSYEGSKD